MFRAVWNVRVCKNEGKIEGRKYKRKSGTIGTELRNIQ